MDVLTPKEYKDDASPSFPTDEHNIAEQQPVDLVEEMPRYDSSAIRGLKNDLDDIDSILDKQRSLQDTLASQGNYIKFIDNRFNKLDELAHNIENKKTKDESDIKLMDEQAYQKLNFLDQKIDRLLEENKTKQSGLEEAIRDLIVTLQEKNKTIVSRQPTSEELPQVIQEVNQNINDLDTLKTLDVNPELINNSKEQLRNTVRENLVELDEEPLNEEPLNEEPLNEEPLNEEPLNEEPLNEEEESSIIVPSIFHEEPRRINTDELLSTNQNMIQNINTNMEKIQNNQNQLQVARKLLDKFREEYEKTLIKVLETTPSNDPQSNTHQLSEEIKSLKENQKIIKDIVQSGKTECELQPTKTKLGVKQNKVADMCIELNKKKLAHMNMIDGVVKKHIQTRQKYTKKYTNRIRRELNNLRQKIARRNVDLAILLDQL